MESQGMAEEALDVATDPEHRFELAIQLGKLDIAKDIALVAQSESKWKQLGEVAMSTGLGLLDMAEDCLKRANDLSGLLQLYAVLGNAEKIAKLIPLAKDSRKNNIAFSCLFTLGILDECLQLLVDSNRMPEAALMARAYFPSKVSEIVALWREDLKKVNQKATDPKEYPNRYEDWQVALEVETRAAETRGSYPVAEEYVKYDDRSHVSLVEVFKQIQLDVDKSRPPRELDHHHHHHLYVGQGVEENKKEGENIDGQESPAVKIEKMFTLKTRMIYSLDLHPTEPWVLFSSSSGIVCIWDYRSQVTMKSFDASMVLTAKFIARKDWIVCGTYRGNIRVYSYNTMESIKEFKAHKNYITSVVVHPSLPYILSASDDKRIKLWDWENGWKCTQTFHGHEDYVEQLAFSPRDTYMFASASLDRTIKIWNLGYMRPPLSINNGSCVYSLDFFDTNEKLYLVTGSSDNTAKVWDYETNTCVKTLEGHTDTVQSIVCVNSDINFIITGSKDKTVRIWNAKNYNLEHVFTSELGGVRAIRFIKDSSQVILGCDNGLLVGQVICARS